MKIYLHLKTYTLKKYIFTKYQHLPPHPSFPPVRSREEVRPRVRASQDSSLVVAGRGSWATLPPWMQVTASGRRAAVVRSAVVMVRLQWCTSAPW